MGKKENKNPMLSFDKLREGLGINGDLPEIKKPESSEPVIENQPVIKRVIPKAGKSVFENGVKFIDITEQYTAPQEATPETYEITETKRDEQVATPVTQKPKKRIRTFNEIFSDFFSAFLPVKGDSGKEKVRKIIMDMSVILIVFCVVGFIQLFVERTVEPTDTNPNLNNNIVEKLSNNSYSKSWQEVLNNNSSVNVPDGIKPEFTYFYTANNDMAGWIKIQNTNLDVQVVQGDDNETYQNKDFNNNVNKSGCPYVDYKNDLTELDDNTIIYGQNLYNNLMFSCLEQYRTIEGYRNSPVIEFSTLYNSYSFKVFAVFVATDNPASDYGFSYTVTGFSSDNKFGEFISEVKQRSLITTDVSVQTDDKIITLVTPTRDFDNARLVVMGRMIRENESTDVNLDSVTLNTSPKYPQAWYDKKGITNPFA